MVLSYFGTPLGISWRWCWWLGPSDEHGNTGGSGGGSSYQGNAGSGGAPNHHHKDSGGHPGTMVLLVMVVGWWKCSTNRPTTVVVDGGIGDSTPRNMVKSIMNLDLTVVVWHIQVLDLVQLHYSGLLVVVVVLLFQVQPSTG